MSNQGYVLTSQVICQSSAAATANGTAVPVAGWSAVSLQVSGTFVGTITFEGTLDDTNWVSLQGANVADGAVGTTATAAGIYTIPCVGLSQFRARVSAWTSGTITAIACAVTAAPGMTLADVDIQAAEAVTATLSAGELHLGEVGGSSINVEVTPTITAGGYTALDTIGGIQTIAGAARATGKPTTLQSLIITDLAMVSPNFRIWFFKSNPAAGTYTDNAALDIHDTDQGLCIGVLDTIDGRWVLGLDNGVLEFRNIGLLMTPTATSLFAVVETVDAETFITTSDLKFIYGFNRD